MSEKERMLVQAAVETFTRYGFRRTTMGDIATTAGLSRQTLYARYSSKEEILAAAIETFGQESLDAIVPLWQAAKTARDVLEVFCQQIIVTQFEMIRQMPDSEDLFSALSDRSKDALTRVQEHYVQATSTRLQELTGINAAGLHAYAEFFVLAAKGLKQVAEDTTVLEAQLSLLTTAVVAQIEALIAEAPPPQ